MDEILGHLQEAMAILTVPDGEDLPFEQVKQAYTELIAAEKRYKVSPMNFYVNKISEYQDKAWNYAKYAQILRCLREAQQLSKAIAAELDNINIPDEVEE